MGFFFFIQNCHNLDQVRPSFYVLLFLEPLRLLNPQVYQWKTGVQRSSGSGRTGEAELRGEIQPESEVQIHQDLVFLVIYWWKEMKNSCVLIDFNLRSQITSFRAIDYLAIM